LKKRERRSPINVTFDKLRLSRKDFLLASLLPAVTFLIPTQALGVVSSSENNDDRYSISIDGDTITVVDNVTGESVFAQLNRSEKIATISYSDGTVSQAYVDSSGTLYVDGEAMLKADAPTTDMSTLAVPSGYVPLVTHRYSASTYDAYINTSSFIAQVLVSLGLSALLPTFVGSIASAIASQLVSMYYNGLPRGYIELKQHYNPNTYYIYTVVSLYRNSNYTGLVKRWEYGPTRPV
jgi:hypothetical protein